MVDIQIFKRHYVQDTTNEHVTTNVALDIQEFCMIETHAGNLIESSQPLVNVITDNGYAYVLEANFMQLVKRWKVARKETLMYVQAKN